MDNKISAAALIRGMDEMSQGYAQRDWLDFEMSVFSVFAKDTRVPRRELWALRQKALEEGLETMAGLVEDDRRLDIPVGLEIVKAKTSFDAFVKDIRATAPFQAFLEILAGRGRAPLALVFRIPRRGPWVIHNMRLNFVPVPRIVLPADGDDRDPVHALSLELFVQDCRNNR